MTGKARQAQYKFLVFCFLFKISLRDVFETSNRVYVIMEYAEGGDLLEFINQDR